MSKQPVSSAPATKPKPSAIKTATSSSLNSKGNNVYAVAYKKVWDQLPPWKRNALTDIMAEKNFDDRLYTEFAKAVITVAEQS